MLTYDSDCVAMGDSSYFLLNEPRNLAASKTYENRKPNVHSLGSLQVSSPLHGLDASMSDITESNM